MNLEVNPISASAQNQDSSPLGLGELPTDVLGEILKRADYSSIKNISLASKTFNVLSKKEYERAGWVWNVDPKTKTFKGKWHVKVHISKSNMKWEQERYIEVIQSPLRNKLIKSMKSLKAEKDADSYCYTVNGAFNGEKIVLNLTDGEARKEFDARIFDEITVFPVNMGSANFYKELEGIRKGYVMGENNYFLLSYEGFDKLDEKEKQIRKNEITQFNENFASSESIFFGKMTDEFKQMALNQALKNPIIALRATPGKELQDVISTICIRKFGFKAHSDPSAPQNDQSVSSNATTNNNESFLMKIGNKVLSIFRK